MRKRIPAGKKMKLNFKEKIMASSVHPPAARRHGGIADGGAHPKHA